MASNEAQSWNRGRYWGATVVLAALLVISGLLALRNATSATQISNELHMPIFLGTYILPVAQIMAAAIILWPKFPTLRTFAYAWAHFYFAIELLLVANAKDWILTAFSVVKIVVWALAFWWDRDRIKRKVTDGRSESAVR